MDIEIFYENQGLSEQAIEIAQRFNFQCRGIICPEAFNEDNKDNRDNRDNRDILQLTSTGLMVFSPHSTPWQIDFLSASRHYRRFHGGKETLARACGVKKNKSLTIVDATAGYGKDGFILACLGAHVILLERHPIMAALLDDALKRFYADPVLSRDVDLALYFDDATNFLTTSLKDALPDLPDVIYWDPMHPVRQKSAQVKKDMFFLQQWVSPERDPESLIRLSLPYAKDRVVLKWPRKAQSLQNFKPSFIYEEKTVRFEVFIGALSKN